MPSQIAWLVTTTIAVLFLAIFGTAELLANNGAGSGSGPNPVTKPSGASLPVQVIGQQWEFTYRYPTYGGVETAQLVLPVGQQIDIPCDVARRQSIRSGRTSSASRPMRIPGVDNVAYVKPEKIGTFQIRCAELCGLWHGYMFDTGRIVSAAQLQDVDRSAQRAVRRRREVPADVQHVVLPRPAVPRRMNLAPPDRVQPADGGRARASSASTLGWWLGHQITGPSIEYFGDTGQNDIALFVAYFVGVIGFLVGLGFANYPVQRMLGKPPSLREKEQQGIGPLLRALHRSQGRRHPVPAGHRRVHLHRRPERDADPVRADAAPAPGLERQQLPHPGRGARHDDDGDDDERDPRPVRELLRPADDRLAADGLPAHRGAHLLAPDGGGDGPDDVAGSSAASRPAGPATRR